MKAVLLRGGPAFVKRELSESYYSDVKEFLTTRGFECFDDPEQIDDVDLIVAHGKAVPIVQTALNGVDSVKVLLGHPDGVINPDDLQWQQSGKGIPPDDHLIFTADQKLAVENAISKLTSKKNDKPALSRQSASNRPGVR